VETRSNNITKKTARYLDTNVTINHNKTTTEKYADVTVMITIIQQQQQTHCTLTKLQKALPGCYCYDNYNRTTTAWYLDAPVINIIQQKPTTSINLKIHCDKRILMTIICVVNIIDKSHNLAKSKQIKNTIAHLMNKCIF